MFGPIRLLPTVPSNARVAQMRRVSEAQAALEGERLSNNTGWEPSQRRNVDKQPHKKPLAR